MLSSSWIGRPGGLSERERERERGEERAMWWEFVRWSMFRFI